MTAALAVFAAFGFGCGAQPAPEWRGLFDGTSLKNWKGYKTDAVPAGWKIENGTLAKDAPVAHIVSKDEFGDFELELEWTIGEAGNRGIFYRGTEEYDHIYWSAPEYQLLDNLNAADNKKDNHLAGSVYDLYAVPKDAAKPANEWNQTRIVAKGNHVEHWLNGKKVASYDVGSPDWDTAIKGSKFTPDKYPNFGKAPKGYLGIQGDHPGTLALRNIRIRELQ
jgi:hypothetical protein